MSVYLKNLKKYFSVILLILFCSNVSHSYNHERCKKGVEKYSTFNFMDVSSSTSQFVSSTGDCKMIGMAEYDKRVFLSQNFENMKIDSARGTGEYLEAYAIVSMCDLEVRNELFNAFQKNFTSIYGGSVEKEPEQVYEAMERMMRTNSILSSGCYQKM